MDATLKAVTEADFAPLRTLAATIWHEHYVGIITPAQIDYMLAGRFSDEALRQTLAAPHKWLELLVVGGTPVGYCASERAPLPGTTAADALKLGQLYLLASHRGLGLGKRMLRHVESRADELGRKTMFLQVNKRNTGAINFYKTAGFEIIQEAVFDIGSGFVMDDYVMAKCL